MIIKAADVFSLFIAKMTEIVPLRDDEARRSKNVILLKILSMSLLIFQRR